jgi:SAM-dependent methyltransferase
MEGVSPTLTSEPFVYSGTELEAMAQARNYCQWILRYFAPYLGGNIVEIGAGSGTFSQLLLDRKNTAQLVLFEAAVNLLPLLRRRFTDPRVQLHCGSFDPAVLTQSPDSVVLVNVLEHVRDDTLLLSQIHASLRKGGSLLLFVPAFQWNYGSLDQAFDHYRRYTGAELERKIQNVGFRLERRRYINLMGIASWFLAGKVLRQTTIKASQVRWYDRWIIPWSFKLEQFCKPPIGQSLLAVAIK